MVRQTNGLPSAKLLARHLDAFRPDVLLGIETLFSRDIYALARSRGIKTAVVAMHEAYVPGGEDPDLWICPVHVAYDRIAIPNKTYFDWPIDIRPFPFAERREAKRLLHIMGYGAAHNRRQTREVAAGFLLAGLPDSTLTVHCQQPAKTEYGQIADPRVMYRFGSLPNPADLYEGFDVLIQPDSYAGYNRVLLEAQASGMPVLTTDGPPMNELVRDPDHLIPATPSRYDFCRLGRGPECYRYLVSTADVATAIRRTLTWDIPAKSRAARANAEARSWTDERKTAFSRLLEQLRQ